MQHSGTGRRLRSAPPKKPLEDAAASNETETANAAAQTARSQPLRNNRRTKRSTQQNDGAVETKQTETQAPHAVDSSGRCTRATSRTKTGSVDDARAQSKARSRSRAGSNSPLRMPRPRESVDMEAERIMTR
ncbi:hypothetical protein LPJ56_006203, partial [Coemansia sp. RSA 2599]